MMRWFPLALTFSFLLCCVNVATLDSVLDGDNLSKSNGIDRRKTTEEQLEGFTLAPHYAGCGSCKKREEIKERNLELLKEDILRKMGFKSAPNMTGKVLPHVPPHILSSLDLDYYGMQSDEPQFKPGPTITEEIDDYHVKTEKIISFAEPRKFQ